MRGIAVGCLLLAACSQNARPVQPFTFNRPERVAFACFDNVGSVFVPLAQCEGLELDGDIEDFALIALVTQTAQGELAAVDVDDRLVLDTDERVPGFTFAVVGENPSAVVAPTTNPGHVFVANRSSRTITTIPLSNLHPAASPTGMARSEISLPGAPADLAISPDEDFLYVAFPDRGTIGELSVDPAHPTSPLTWVREISLDTTVPTAVAAVDAPVYERICPESFADILPRPRLIAPRAPVSLGATAAPVSFAIDASSTPPALLVADAQLPIIHRVALGATGGDPATLPPLAPAVPTREIVLTPPVPAAIGVRDATERYLYAIDAIDGTVLTVDYGATSPNFGAVLPVGTGHRAADRMHFSSPAESLGVLTPNYQVSGGEAPAECDPSDSSQAEDASTVILRGVFLAVGRLDGAVSFVDVYDLDAPCRGGANCQGPEIAADVHVRIQRHRPRIRTYQTEPLALLGIPSLTFDGSPGQIQSDGTTATGQGPGLEPLDGCPEGMIKVFPTEGDLTFACVSVDPWSNPAQLWVGLWEGRLSGAVGAGAFDDSDPSLFVAESDRFCDWGTLGETDVVASSLPAEDPLVGYVGDRIVFTGELAPSIQRALEEGTNSAFEVCRQFLDVDERDPIYLEIIEAFEDSVRVRTPIARDPTGAPRSAPAPVAYTIEDVRTCFPGVSAFAVHTRAAFTVQSTLTTFLHRVVSVAGACRVDTSLPLDPTDPQTLVEGRAIIGRPYVNPYVSFHISETRADGEPLTTIDGIDARFSVATQAHPGLVFRDDGRIVSEVVQSPTGPEFFVIDPAAGTFNEMNATGITLDRSFQ